MLDAPTRFRDAFAECPLVAVLRGLTPAEAPKVGDALVEAGFTLIEVPLNSPDPLESIGLLSRRYDNRIMIGAGTVLSREEVMTIADAGGTLIVSPNTDLSVIAATVEAGLISLPGFLTPSEGFSALAAGAHALKLFPVEGFAPEFLKAQRAVLPREIRVLPVGGITPENMASWRAAGADGFGIGSNLYRPGKPPEAVAEDAWRFVAALKETV